MGITDVLRKTCTLELVQSCLEFPFLQFLAVWTGWASVYSAHARGYCPRLRTGKGSGPRDLAPGIGLVKTQRVQKWVWFGFGLIAKLCPTLCNPMNCSLPGSSVCGIFQARTLEWVAISSSRGSSWPRDWTRVSCIAGRFFTVLATRKARHIYNWASFPLWLSHCILSRAVSICILDTFWSGRAHLPMSYLFPFMGHSLVVVNGTV